MFKKIKNKKTMIAIIVSLFVVVVGTTYALFFSNTSIANLFSIGNFNVVTTETFTSPASWQPGQEIPKSITATNNGDIQAAFRVKYTESWVDSNNNPISNVPANAVTINFINTRDWTYNSTDGYYYYNWIIEPGDTTRSLISGMTLNQSLTGNASCVEDGNTYNCSSSLSGLSGATYTITFTKETVIYSKYQQFWNTEQEISEYVEPVPLYSLPTGKNAYNLQVGDEVCINGDTTECFNFIGYDGNNVKLLAKYNLKVGKIYNYSSTQTGTYSSNDDGYGLQSSDAKGWVYYQTRYGTVAFSQTSYWYDGSNLKSKYGSAWDTNNIYDTDYKTEPDFSGNGFNTTGYSIAYYVEEYKDKLEDYGATINDARLLTYAEAIDSSIGCNQSNYSCPTNGFITNTSFWLGSANSQIYLCFVRSDGIFNNGYGYSIEYNFGVRPVIVISKSEVNANVDDANKKQPAEISLPSGRTKDNLQLGDEICVEGDTTECFNFIRYDGDNVVMLAKYNLKVGGNYSTNTGANVGSYGPNTIGYGLQSSQAIGVPSSGNTNYGTVKFSTTSNYVEIYQQTLEEYGLDVYNSRLLTLNEATSNILCSTKKGTCPTTGISKFIVNTSFWLDTAYDYQTQYIIRTNGTLGGCISSVKTTYGVRPVIVINKNVIQ